MTDSVKSSDSIDNKFWVGPIQYWVIKENGWLTIRIKDHRGTVIPEWEHFSSVPPPLVSTLEMLSRRGLL